MLSTFPWRAAALGTLTLVLAAQTPPPPPPASKLPATGAPAGAPATPPGAAQAQKPFAEVVKDAKETKGFFTLWQKEDKVWIEIAPDQLDKPFFFQANISRGLGEGYLYNGTMLNGNSQLHLVAFQKVNAQIQFLQKNSIHNAAKGSPVAEAVASGFSDSLLASAPVVSQPHPERKSILVEASALLFSDIPAIAFQMEQIYRQNYAFDARNTSFQKLRGSDEETTLDVQAHFQLPRIATPPPGPATGGPVPRIPGSLADPRSMFIGLLYSFRRLPAEPMRPRVADDRVGYFTTRTMDFSEATDQAKDRVVHYVTRWRLEKKDPSAALSEPKKPIVYWLDKNIPEKWRKPIADGILEWNKAFERIGFKDAVQVKQQPADADWDTSDASHASVRWMVASEPGFVAIGPSNYDPRTGEILDADVGFNEVLTRRGHSTWLQENGRRQGFASQEASDVQVAAQQMDLGATLLESRGELPAEGPEYDAFMYEWVKYISTHEIGHTLGLTHNFRGSTIYAWDQLADKAFTRENGLAGSIMEYMAVNLAPKGEKQGQPYMTTLGPYDYWAIEYAYKPIEPAQEAQELARIASRSHEKYLGFGRDEEVAGMDPEVNMWDIGPDVLEFAQRQARITREVMGVLEAKQLKSGESYEVLARRFNLALATFGQACGFAAKHVGGVIHLRDHAGSPRLPLNPVPAAKQRDTLKFLEGTLFSDAMFKVKPEFLRKMTFDRTDFGPVNQDYDLGARVLGYQRAVLNQLTDGSVARRILSSEAKATDPKQAFHLSELYDSLQNAVWSELKGTKDVSVLRRNLQREHLRILAGQVVRPAADLPADARALARESLKFLQAQLKAAAAKPGFGKEAKAHFQESLAVIEESLKASLQKAGV